MASTTTVAFDIIGRDKSASSTFAKVGKSAEQTTGKLSKLGGMSGKLKAGLAGLAAIAGGSVVAGMFSATEAASDLGETISKVNVLFGKRSGRVLEQWAEGAAKKLGQSKKTALDAAATFGIFGKSAGLAGKDLTKFAMQNTKLATDLASFHNSSPEAAIEALGAAFRGEAEPIRAFGVMLDDATLKAEALALGLLKPVKSAPQIRAAQLAVADAQRALNTAISEHGKYSAEAERAGVSLGLVHERLKKETEGTIGPLTAQQKILAAQAATFKQTSDAQGDFARTSGGLANQQRILKAQLENVKAQIGEKLLPIFLAVTTWINDKGIPAAKKFGEKMAEAFRKIREIVEKVWAIVGPILRRWGDRLTDLGSTAMAVADGDYKTATERMGRLTGKTAVDISLSLQEIGVRLLANFASLPAKIFKQVGRIVGSIVRGFKSLPGLMADIASRAATALIDGLVNGLEDGKGRIFGKIGDLAGGMMGALANPLGIRSPSKVFKGYGINIMEGLALGLDQGKTKIEAALAKVLNAVQRYGDKLRNLLGKRSDIVSGFTSGAQSVFGASMTDAEGNEKAPTAGSLIAFQRQQRNQAVSLRRNVNKLLKMGLSRDLIQQMAAQGPSGFAQIAALASGSSAQIAQLNALNTQTNQALTGAGMAAGNALYGDQISKAREQKQAAKAIADELRKVMREANDNQQIIIKLEGRTIRFSLLELKRKNGGAALGLA